MATTWISKIQSGDTAYNIALNSNVIDSSFTLDANQVLKHANSVTAATTYPSNATTASANGGQIIVRDVQYNAQGHITSSRDRTITLSQTTYTLSGLGGIGSATASGNAPLSLSATKSGTALTITGSVAAATTSAAGVIKIDATNTNALLNTLTTGSSTPVDADYFISQYAGGGSTTTTYHRRPVSALWSYIDGKIQNAGYVKSSGVTSITITSGTGITVSDSGTAITGTGTRTITHYTPTGASSTTKGSSAARTYIKQISTDQFGHITGVTTGAETVTDTTYSAGDGITLTGTKFSIASTSVTNAMLQNSSISIAGSSVSLGGSVDATTLRQNLGLSSALRFLGTTTTTMSDGRTTATVAINNTNITPTTGDVVIYGDGEYVWIGSAWEHLGGDSSFKTVQTAITDSTGTAETTTATRFVYSVSQDANGVISVKTRPLPTYNNYSLPLAADGTRGGIQIGYSESGTNYAVKLSSEKAYVTVPWTDTKVTQAAATTAAGAYPVILAYSTATTAVTNTVNKASTLTYNPSTKALSTGGTVNGYTLAAASAKAVDTSIAAASTSTNLPTSQAVASFVEGKGYSTTDTKNTAGSTDTSSKIYLIGATSQTASTVTYSDNEVFATSGVLTAKTFNSTALTASQAVSTDANKNLVSTNLTVAANSSGSGLTFIDTISQSAVGKISITTKAVRTATTGQTGIVQLSSLTTSDSETLAATPKAVKAAYDLATTANTAANNHKYWANIESTSAATYNKAPEMATLKLNGNTGATAASTSNVTLIFNTTTNALDFVFA